MTRYLATPQYRITTTYGGISYPFTCDQFPSGRITRVENGFDTATLLCNDYKLQNYASKMSEGSAVKIEFKDASESSWGNAILDNGVIRFINQTLDPELLELKCDGAGYGFGETLCNQEYGLESTLGDNYKHVGEILDDFSYGLIKHYVNHILGSNNSTGYNYLYATDAGAAHINYYYCPYKINSKIINDLIDIEQGALGTSAGLHWIVAPDVGGQPKFLCTTIGDHSAAAIAAGWTNYYGGSPEAAIFTQDIDFKDSYFQRLPKEANYIVYAGAFRRPGDGDAWTENVQTKAIHWHTDMFGTGPCTLSDGTGAGNFKFGLKSLKAVGDNNGVADFDFYYPDTREANWNITKIGGKHNIPTVSFHCKVDNNVDHNHFYEAKIYFFHSYNVGPPIVVSCFWHGFADKLTHNIDGDDVWHSFRFPVGPYYKTVASDQVEWYEFNSPSWTNIIATGFEFQSASGVKGTAYIDGLSINGSVIRVARPKFATEGGTDFSSANPCKMKLITDDVGKDDTMIATDDSGTIARLAYAEYLRSKTTPIVGWIKTPLLKDLLPGMLLHIRAKPNAEGDFNIDRNFRVARLDHDFNVSGSETTSYLTDDVVNATPREGFTEAVCMDLNKLLSAVRPEWQDRQASSIKSRDVDITQVVLERGY